MTEPGHCRQIQDLITDSGPYPLGAVVVWKNAKRNVVYAKIYTQILQPHYLDQLKFLWTFI